MAPLSPEDVDDLLGDYLSEEVPVEPVSKLDCRATHRALEAKMEKEIKETAGRTSTSIKLWAVGSAFGAFLAVIAGFTCAMTEVGAYKERVDSAIRQNEELKQDLKEVRNEIRGIRDLLLRRESP